VGKDESDCKIGAAAGNHRRGQAGPAADDRRIEPNPAGGGRGPHGPAAHHPGTGKAIAATAADHYRPAARPGILARCRLRGATADVEAASEETGQAGAARQLAAPAPRPLPARQPSARCREEERRIVPAPTW